MTSVTIPSVLTSATIFSNPARNCVSPASPSRSRLELDIESTRSSSD